MLLRRANSPRRCLPILLLLWGISSVALASDWTYAVRPGDDLWRLAAKYCGSSSYATRLAQHNGLASPRALRAGTRLNIPVQWLVRQPAEVTVRSVAGSVSRENGESVAAGDTIEMGQRLITADGFAVVVFADGSRLEVGQDTEVLFNVLTAFGDSGMVDTHLRFYRGRGAARVIKKSAPSKFRIWTPSGIAAVRGTDFRVASNPAAGKATSRVETVTGAVEFEAAARTLALPAGFGVVASAAGAQKEALLPAPTLLNPALALWQPNQSVRWQPVADAAGYQVKLYQVQPGGLMPIRSVSQSDTNYVLTDLAAGEYAFAVRAVAASGIEGFDDQFRLRMGSLAPQLAPSASLLPSASLRWPTASDGSGYVLQIDRTRAFPNPSTDTLLHNQRPLQDTVANAPGVYFWRVRQTNSAFSEPQRLEVRPPPVTQLEVNELPAAPGAKVRRRPLALRWQQRADETYTVVVRQAGQSTSAFARSGITGDQLQLPVFPEGRYDVSVVATSGGVASEAVHRELQVSDPPPWWSPGVLLLPLLLL